MIAGVILAAGASSRMGRTKALLPVGDDVFVTRMVRTFLSADIQHVVVVCADDIRAIRTALDKAGLSAIVVENAHPEEGQLSSLQVGLSALTSLNPDAIAVSLVDVPLVSAETIRAVVSAWRQTRAPVVRPACAGRHGHPVIFDRLVFEQLRRADLAVGAKAVVRAHAIEAV
jgi:molybdenum cofactor cytidylyltransferase